MTADVQREPLVDLLVAHQRRGNGGGCLCGGVRLGESYPEHVSDLVLPLIADAEKRAAARALRPVCGCEQGMGHMDRGCHSYGLCHAQSAERAAPAMSQADGLREAARGWILRHSSQPDGDRWRDNPSHLDWAAENLLCDLAPWIRAALDPSGAAEGAGR